jgi:HEAT repeat protein
MPLPGSISPEQAEAGKPLPAWGPGDDPVPGLMELLNSDDERQVLNSIENLARLGPLAAEAIPALRDKLNAPAAGIRNAATRAIGQMGAAAIEALTYALKHNDKDVRRQAIWALGRMGARAAPAVTAICQVLTDPDSRIAFGAAQALGNIGSEAVCAVPSLLRALSTPNAIQRRLIAWALGEIGPEALPAVLSKLDDPDVGVRQEAAAAIGYMGPLAKSAVGPILAYLQRRQLLSEGSELETEKPSEAFKVIANQPAPDNVAESDDRVYFIDALARIGPAAGEAREYLSATTTDRDRKVAQAAAQAMLRIMGWN